MIDWQALRDTTGTLSLLKVAADLGLQQESCLNGTHLDFDNLEQPFQSVRVWQELALLRNIQSLSQQTAGLGLKAADYYGIHALGLLGLGMSACQTLGEALAYPQKYHAFGLSFSNISTHDEAGTLFVQLEEGAVPQDCQQFCIERGLAVFHRWTQDLMGTDYTAACKPIKLQLRQDQSDNTKSFSQYFDCEIEFSASHNRLHLNKIALNKPLKSASKRNQLLCDHYSERFQQQLKEASSFEFTVCEIIKQQGFDVNAKSIADALNINERQLRRQLANQGSGLRQCLLETRMKQACIALKQNQTIDQVADTLAYKDKSSFARAFKTYTGKSPGKYP